MNLTLWGRYFDTRSRFEHYVDDTRRLFYVVVMLFVLAPLAVGFGWQSAVVMKEESRRELQMCKAGEAAGERTPRTCDSLEATISFADKTVAVMMPLLGLALLLDLFALLILMPSPIPALQFWLVQRQKKRREPTPTETKRLERMLRETTRWFHVDGGFGTLVGRHDRDAFVVRVVYRNYMVLPLLPLMTPSGTETMRAVSAHELAHLSQGDVRYPWMEQRALRRIAFIVNVPCGLAALIACIGAPPLGLFALWLWRMARSLPDRQKVSRRLSEELADMAGVAATGERYPELFPNVQPEASSAKYDGDHLAPGIRRRTAEEALRWSKAREASGRL